MPDQGNALGMVNILYKPCRGATFDEKSGLLVNPRPQIIRVRRTGQHPGPHLFVDGHGARGPDCVQGRFTARLVPPVNPPPKGFFLQIGQGHLPIIGEMGVPEGEEKGPIPAAIFRAQGRGFPDDGPFFLPEDAGRFEGDRIFIAPHHGANQGSLCPAQTAGQKILQLVPAKPIPQQIGAGTEAKMPILGPAHPPAQVQVDQPLGEGFSQVRVPIQHGFSQQGGRQAPVLSLAGDRDQPHPPGILNGRGDLAAGLTGGDVGFFGNVQIPAGSIFRRERQQRGEVMALRDEGLVEPMAEPEPVPVGIQRDQLVAQQISLSFGFRQAVLHQGIRDEVPDLFILAGGGLDQREARELSGPIHRQVRCILAIPRFQPEDMLDSLPGLVLDVGQGRALGGDGIVQLAVCGHAGGKADDLPPDPNNFTRDREVRFVLNFYAILLDSPESIVFFEYSVWAWRKRRKGCQEFFARQRSNFLVERYQGFIGGTLQWLCLS